MSKMLNFVPLPKTLSKLPGDKNRRAKIASSANEIRKRAELLLKQFVDLNTPTSDAAAVNEIQSLVANWLQDLGFEMTREPNRDSRQASGDLIVAELRTECDRFITLVTHTDTVLTTEQAGRFTLSADGNTARGSGVIDNKGGLVVALEGVRHFLETYGRPKTFSLRFVISPNEEAGSIGFQDRFRALAEDSPVILGFEPALDDGSIIESRRGNRWYQIEVEGQEAHAGRCRGEQINAAHDLALKIAKLQKLNRQKEGLAVNIAQIQGGRDRFNVVCGRISAKLDARFPSFKKRDALHRKIESILLKPAVRSKVTGREAQTCYTIEDDCPPFSTTRESKKYLKLYLKQISLIENRSVRSEKAGGAGDVNYMSRVGAAVIDGLGPVGGKMHTEHEFISLPSLGTRALALAEFLNHVGKI